jgi:twitching motility protein PilT
MFHKAGASGSYRMIPARIPRLEELGLRNLDAVKKLLNYHNGLILVTGPVGSGKTTTLAALVAELNASRQDHIITVEDPIEFVHQNKQSVIVHREVGDHTRSFGATLKGAMRHDPDIILVGEMRELETIKLALSCANMGMLVFGTLHTNTTPKTIDRIINAFPAEEQNQVRVMLAGCLAGVVAQLRCKRVPQGRCAVHEILLQHEALPHTLRSGQIHTIRALIEGGGADGMITTDQSQLARVQDGSIEPKEAYLKAANKAPFTALLKPSELGFGHG